MTEPYKTCLWDITAYIPLRSFHLPITFRPTSTFLFPVTDLLLSSFPACQCTKIEMSWDDERVVCGGDEVKHSVRYWEKGPPFRAVTGITCVLSMIGAVLIIVSYVFYKNLRNRARLILVHLSLMDFGVALSNLIGNLIHFDRYYITYNATCMIYHWPPHHYTEYLCEAQAFFAHFFTLGSILWTISLAVYLYFLLMHSRTSLAPISLTISYFTCYAVPLFICLWLLFTHKFGYSSKSFGWCTLLVFSDMTHQSNVFGAVIGYDLWVYLAMTFVIALYLAVQLFLREKVGLVYHISVPVQLLHLAFPFVSAPSVVETKQKVPT